MSKVILSTAYLAPIQYYSKLLKYDEAVIEIYENYPKQTYRNRCSIYGANGLLDLSIPVKKIQTKTKTKDIKIEYVTNWQKLHWKSIESAYRSSPYFEYYADDFLPFYTTKTDFLIDYNLALQNLITMIIGIEVQIKNTDNYIVANELIFADYRELINPKKRFNDPDFKQSEYTQVFSNRFSFIPNLSIIDLLFNVGPDSLIYLKRTIC
ncbi:MAG: WbqC family protein [Bacteroidales bacterium]